MITVPKWLRAQKSTQAASICPECGSESVVRVYEEGEKLGEYDEEGLFMPETPFDFERGEWLRDQCLNCGQIFNSYSGYKGNLSGLQEAQQDVNILEENPYFLKSSRYFEWDNGYGWCKASLRQAQMVPQEMPEGEVPPEEELPELPVPDEFEKAPEIPEEVWQRLPQSQRIRYAAVNNFKINIEYFKQGQPGENEQDVMKTYVGCEPYSYRIKRPVNKGGAITWYLFAWCNSDSGPSIKAFIVRRIENVEVTDEVFAPRWKVEFWAPERGW